MAHKGRPLKLKADDATIGIVQGLAQIQCTQLEAAAVLHVSHQTFMDFLDRHRGKMRKIWDEAKEQGKVSLRRTQFRQAQTHIAMAIFLGKNYLGQSDRVGVEGTVQHQISAELHKLLMVEDGKQRSLPDYLDLTPIDGPEEVREPGVANGQLVSNRQRNGSDGNV